MGGVDSPFPMEVHRRVARIIVCPGGRVPIPSREALEARRSLDQGAVHREVLVGQQAAFMGLGHHFIKELLAHSVLQQPLTVLGEHRGIEAALHEVHVQEPAEQSAAGG